MTPRATSRPDDSFETRVLAALATGASRPEEVAAGLTESPDRVRSTLEAAIQTGLVERADLPGGRSYSLTATGLGQVGLTQAEYDAARGVAAENTARDQAASALPDTVAAPVDVATDVPVDAPAAAPVAAPVDAPAALPVAAPVDVPVDHVEPTPRKVTWRHLVYAVVYVVVGLVFLALQPVVGVLLMLAGLVLAAFTLRPLLHK